MLGGLGFGLFQTPNNRNMLLSAPKERSGAVIMALLFTVAETTTAPRIGLAVGAVLALAGGLVSVLRVGTTSQAEPTNPA